MLARSIIAYHFILILGYFGDISSYIICVHVLWLYMMPSTLFSEDQSLISIVHVLRAWHAYG